MLWGRYQYKHQLLAEPKILYRLIVYPSMTQMLMQPMTVLRIFFYGRYVRSIQSLQDYLQREKNPGWQWLYHQCRSLKKILGLAGRGFTWVRARNPDADTDISMLTAMKNDSCIDLAGNTDGNLIGVSRTNVIGTAAPSRCPIQIL
jgi:hypothetical protein